MVDALVTDRDEAFQGILQAARVGDEFALAGLYRNLHPRILRYARARGASDPEDLAHEVWLSIATGLERFRGGERDFHAWVFTIARRRLADAARRASRRPSVPVSLDRLGALGEVGDVEEEEAMRSLETQEALERISTLPRAQAEVLLLRLLGGLDVEAVSRILRKRPGAVRVLQHRALARLAAQAGRGEVENRGLASVERRDRR
jgi:RNA polymerase sigma-70 factor (ECF subfamily)